MSSAPSLPVIVGSPAPPTAVKALSGTTATTTGPLSVTFTPGANNGATTTSYTATCVSSNGGATPRTGSGAASPVTVANATTGKAYTCTVKATNARGAGLASVASLAVIVGSPAPPTVVTATKIASGQVKVTFTPGANNGATTTSYTATCVSTNGGTTRAASGPVSPLTVTLLTVGKTYTCTVKGTNARGAGLASNPSAAVVP